MNTLKQLIPDEMREHLNRSPFMKWGVLVLMVVVGLMVLRKGILGIRKRHIISKGKTYTGTGAVWIGGSFVVTGTLLLIGTVAVSLGFSL